MAYGTGGCVDKHKQKEKQTEAREIHHEDLALKTAAQYFGKELLPLLGILLLLIVLVFLFQTV